MYRDKEGERGGVAYLELSYQNYNQILFVVCQDPLVRLKFCYLPFTTGISEEDLLFTFSQYYFQIVFPHHPEHHGVTRDTM